MTRRCFWKFGVVIELITRRDGETEAALVKTHPKDG